MAKGKQKQKTHRGAAKRFKVTATGKVRRMQAMKSHILTKKTSGRKRRLRKSVQASRSATRLVKHLLQA